MAALWLPACDPADAAESETGESGPVDPCDNEERGMIYSAGMEVQSDAKLFRANIMDAAPAPPARFINEWEMQFELTGDGSLDEVEVVVFPWMPDHGHGSSNPLLEVIPGEGAGSYTIANLDLHMAGYWEVHFDLDAADGSWSDRATFAFCVE